MTDMNELRCRTCGLLLGYTHHSGRLVTWCSGDCARSPLSNYEERDELICELFLQGWTTTLLAERFNTTYQNVQQILKRWNVWSADREVLPEEPVEPVYRFRLPRVKKEAVS